MLGIMVMRPRNEEIESCQSQAVTRQDCCQFLASPLAQIARAIARERGIELNGRVLRLGDLPKSIAHGFALQFDQRSDRGRQGKICSMSNQNRDVSFYRRCRLTGSGRSPLWGVRFRLFPGACYRGLQARCSVYQIPAITQIRINRMSNTTKVAQNHRLPWATR